LQLIAKNTERKQKLNMEIYIRKLQGKTVHAQPHHTNSAAHAKLNLIAEHSRASNSANGVYSCRMVATPTLAVKQAAGTSHLWAGHGHTA
jgi:hypothetical protein